MSWIWRFSETQCPQNTRESLMRSRSSTSVFTDHHNWWWKRLKKCLRPLCTLPQSEIRFLLRSSKSWSSTLCLLSSLWEKRPQRLSPSDRTILMSPSQRSKAFGRLLRKTLQIITTISRECCSQTRPEFLMIYLRSRLWSMWLQLKWRVLSEKSSSSLCSRQLSWILSSS